jgi:hypothetical protein
MDQSKIRAILRRLQPLLAEAVSDARLPCAGDWGIQEQMEGSGLTYLELSATLCRVGEPLLAPPPASYGRLRVRVTEDPWDGGPVVHFRLTTDDWCKAAFVEAWDRQEIARALQKVTRQCEIQREPTARGHREHWKEFLRGD